MFGRFAALKNDTSALRRKFLDCPYGEDHKQSLDIYLPDEGDGPFPAVFFLHGGGWTAGNKKDAQILPFMSGVQRGYAVVGLGYRLVPHIRYPDNLFDVKAALRWVAENAASYLIDPDHVALTGASAGAHLAMMAAFTQGQAAFEGAPLSKTCTVRAVVDQYGPTDFLRQAAQYDASGYTRMRAPDDTSPESVDELLGVPLKSVPNLACFVNPLDNVHPGIPPVLIQHGRYDPCIPYQQATELYEKIVRTAGEGNAVLDISETYTHADPGYADPESVGRTFAFLDGHLKNNKKKL
ncbi:Acetyl esterase/lipase [Sporobacter termitidis DSM 10068]|uniref:Acetyl esterase/lipase n=1 Tax=Sporobacter termitidis DSM 10068 TaxID=1123282 RepID=A0A1M5TWY1_9FIRM|nr:alpha/beta hydrolase [Sporobacter termitidis]SHH54893.1 Acetyl esterase/lipase [Sporobacter termitidis DSM 10068]